MIKQVEEIKVSEKDYYAKVRSGDAKLITEIAGRLPIKKQIERGKASYSYIFIQKVLKGRIEHKEIFEIFKRYVDKREKMIEEISAEMIEYLKPE